MDSFLTKEQLESLMFRLTAVCLGLDPTAEPTQSRIRISWPTDAGSHSNPGWDRDEDVVFIRLEKTPDPYTALEDVQYGLNEAGEFVEKVVATVCHSVYWIFYGPSATEDAETLRHMLVRPETRYSLDEYNLYVIPHIDAPIRADELDSGQWWHRVDLRAQFYEGTERQYAANAIDEVSISIEKGD